MNLYAYVNGNPINRIDPKGLEELGITVTNFDHIAFIEEVEAWIKYLNEEYGELWELMDNVPELDAEEISLSSCMIKCLSQEGFQIGLGELASGAFRLLLVSSGVGTSVVIAYDTTTGIMTAYALNDAVKTCICVCNQ